MSDQNDHSDALAITLFSEMFMADQLARARLARALPKGMELSHFSVLNHLARTKGERTPAQLALAWCVRQPGGEALRQERPPRTQQPG